MKHFNFRQILALWCFLGILFSPATVFGQLSGSYTINPTLAASNTNYQNWASAVGDLTTGTRNDLGTPQGPAVSGPVVFTVYDSIYGNTQVQFTAISGTSAINTITFQSAGGDSSTCVLQAPSSTLAANDFVLMLNGASHLIFKKIGFERTGNNVNSTVIQITNNTSNIKFDNCWMKGRRVPSNLGNGFQYGIGSIIHFTGSGNNIEFNQNKIIYGYNGVYGTSTGSNNKFFNNVFDTSGSSGIYLTNQSSGLEVTGNTFNMGDFGPNMGHYVSYALRLENSPSMKITKNKIYMLAVNAQIVRAIILANTTSTAADPILVNNNFIMNKGGTGDCSGFAAYNCHHVEFYYNNVLILNSLTNATAYYHYPPPWANSNVHLVNNNLINKGNGYVYSVPGTNTADLGIVDYNNGFTNGAFFGNWGGTNHSTFSAWRTASGKDVNSVNVDPGFYSDFDLHVSNVAINGKAIPYARVTDDIDGEPRDPLTPDIGADEFFPSINDAGVSTLDSPSKFCAGTHNVIVTLENYGADTLKSAVVNWQVNGTSQTALVWSGSIAPGSALPGVALGSFSFVANTAYTIKAWTSLPNNTIDENNSNDTLLITRTAGVSGSYTIGPNQADYISFNAAISDMAARGICGPVTFNVQNGIYQEQLTLLKLDGMGASNPVLFQSISQDSTQVWLTLPSTTATSNNNAVVQLRGAENVTFKGMTFERTGFNQFAQVIHILNGSHNNTFTNCQMIGVTTGNINAVNIWSDQAQDTGNAFLYNYIKFGTQSMQFAGTAAQPETGTVIIGNVFDSAYNNAVHISYNNGVVIKNNTFLNTSITALGNYQLQLSHCNGAIDVSGNYFYDGNPEIAIQLSNCNATASDKGLISNNSIINSSGTGILLESSSHQNLVNNSIYFSGTNAASRGIASTGVSSNILLQNNNVFMENGQVFNFPSAAHLNASNYNNLFTNGTQFATLGTVYNNFAAYKTGTQQDLNSVSVDPLFVSATKLEPIACELNNSGVPFPGVTVDIEGKPRSATAPDIGAYEISPSLLLPPSITTVENCLPGPAQIIATSNDPTNEFLWYSTALGGTVLHLGDTFTTAHLNVGDTLKYYVETRSNTGNSCPDGRTEVITTVLSGMNAANVFPSSLFQGVYDHGGIQGLDLVCAGDTLVYELIPQTGLPNSQYGQTWEISHVSIETSDNSTPLNYTFSQPSSIGNGTFRFVPDFSEGDSVFVLNITFKELQHGCEKNFSRIITVAPSPQATFTANNGCVGKNMNFTNTTVFNGSGSISYSWNFGDNATSTAQNPQHLYTQTGNYNVELTVTSNQGCVTKTSHSITINALPEAMFSHTGNCSQDSVYFTNQSIVHAGSSSYIWNFDRNNDTSTDENPSYFYGNIGHYLVKLIVENNGCFDTIIRAVEVAPSPIANFTANEVCLNETTIFNNTTATPPGQITYTWTIQGTTISDEHPTHVFTTAGQHSVLLHVINPFGCTDEVSKIVNVKELPDASYSYNFISGGSYEFQATATGHSSYLWNFKDGNTAMGPSITHNYTQNGNYDVSLLVTHGNGCIDSSIQSINVTRVSVNNIPGPLSSGLNVYPNPYSGQTTIEYTLLSNAEVKLAVYDMSGRMVTSIVDATQTAGEYEQQFSAESHGFGPGTYLVRLVVDGKIYINRIVELR